VKTVPGTIGVRDQPYGHRRAAWARAAGDVEGGPDSDPSIGIRRTSRGGGR
jgi:hypothetical protein